jgi:hypothetical protein
MDVHADVVVPADPERVLAYLDDLGNYPAWMRLVHRVDPDETAVGSTNGETADLAPEQAWFVQLRAKVGPLARSKRLRMERRELLAGSHVVFERAELDGREHAMWRLRAEVRTVDDGTRVDVHLHYGGQLWTGGVLERVLADEIDRGRRALVESVLATDA